MKRKTSVIILLLVFSSLIYITIGQDTLSVRTELLRKRTADSLYTVELLITAQKFLINDQPDSSIAYIIRTVESASAGSFLEIEASGYELLASLNDSRSDWEETLRNYLRAASVYTKLGDKENEAKILHSISNKYFEAGVYKKSAQYSEQEFLLYNNQNPGLLASAAEMAGRSYYYIPVDSLATKWYNVAGWYFEKNGDTTGMIRCTNQSGKLFTRQALFDQAYDKFNKALIFYSGKRDYKNIAATYNQTGLLMFRRNDLNAALADFKKAVESSEAGGKDDSFLTDAWANIAICYQNLGNQQEMMRSFEEALDHARESGRTDEVARIERILAMIYFRKGDNYHAEMYCLNCIESAKASGNFEVLQLCYKDYSNVLENGNDFIKALEYYEKHLSLRDSLNYENRLAENASTEKVAEFESLEQRLRSELATEEIQGLELKTLKAESSRRENELKLVIKERALERSEKDRLAQSLALEQEKYFARESEQKVKSLEQERQRQKLELDLKTEQEKALQNANKLLETEKKQQILKAEKEKQIRKMAVGLVVLMVIVAIMILSGLISTRKKNLKLAESKKHIEKINADLEVTNAEVLKQKDIIEQKNQSITDSIQYASRIQTAVLPPVGFLTEWGLENFILYRPKDIVSGDFYWGVRRNNKIIVAAGDCTGHGVPGAFMSMLGHAFLDEIINTREIADAATILNFLRDEIINTLKQKGTTGEARDGMDISLIILDLRTGKLDYAGANNPLYIIRDGNLIKYQADRMPIGIHFTSFSPFTNQNIEIKKGDYLYIFSDGFADQFGGPKGKKYMYKPFQELLLRNHAKPMELQKEILDNTFEKWKGDREQVDDVMVIGIRV
ncbi:MAG: SpoIIE family protein phosphatase [Bacteroidales bacterium]|jgi:serine phosphatase RsbU (regulator of sigma subunit)|nr:SpoIIE family protein phosphatase [Bacteroidales bacterium]